MDKPMTIITVILIVGVLFALTGCGRELPKYHWMDSVMCQGKKECMA